MTQFKTFKIYIRAKIFHNVILVKNRRIVTFASTICTDSPHFSCDVASCLTEKFAVCC